MYDNNLTTINIESWFIPFDVLNVICLIFGIILAVIFLFIVAIDKTCHTVPMTLVANSCLTALILASTLLGMALFTLQNDYKQIPYQDSLCIFLGYMTYVSAALQCYSY